MAAPARSVITAPTVTFAIGLVLVVAGSFLPWFRSGDVLRNSYQVAGLVGHYGLFDNELVTGALRLWVGVPVLCALCVTLVGVRLVRLGAVLGGLLAVVVGTVATVGVVQASGTDATLGISPSGPLTTATGAVVALVGAVGVMGTAGRTR